MRNEKNPNMLYGLKIIDELPSQECYDDDENVAPV